MHRKPTAILALFVILAAPAWAGWDEGVAAFTKKDFPAAAAEFQKVIDQSPDAYNGYYMLGLTLEQMGKHQESLTSLRKAYDLNPNDLGTKLALARAYKNLRRYGDTAMLLSTVDPSKLPVQHRKAFYQMRAQARSKTNDDGGAYQDLSELAKLSPDDAQVQFNHGRTALAMGELNTAVTSLAKAHQLDAGSSEITTVYVNTLIRRGRMSRDQTAKKQDYLKAAGLAKQLAAARPTYDNLMLQVSAELGAGLYNEAAATGNAALAKKAGDWKAHLYVGQAYSSAGKHDAAAAPLEKALDLAEKPDDVKMIQRQRGFTFEKQKKYRDSIAAYQAAGDQTSVARVQKNQETADVNARIEKENELIEAMRKEEEELKKQLKALEEGGG